MLAAISAVVLAAVAVAQSFHVDPITLTLIVGTIVPLVTNLVTKSSASSRFKGLVMLALAVVAGFATTALENDGNLVFDDTILGVFASVGAAYLSYQAAWKKSGITDAMSASALGTVGLSGPTGEK